MIHIRVRTGDDALRADVEPEALHRLIEDASSLIWLDLESPSPDELALVAGLTSWEHLTVEDLTKQGQRAKLEHFDNYVYVVMHALAYEGDPPRLQTHEIDFVIGANYVATVHYLALPHMTEARDVANHTESVLSDGRDYLVYALTDRLVDSYFPVLDAMHEAVDDLEDHIVTDPTKELLARIFDMKRDAVVLRKATSPQLEVFSRLSVPGVGIATDAHAIYFRDVHDHLIRVIESADGYRDLMTGALDAYLSNVSNRMNDVMKRLTVVAALFLPISFLTGLLGMNLRTQPPWEDNLFWAFLAAMAAITGLQWAYFWKKGWI